MNNKFKRALSSILAFVMLCSCMCMMNVSSVLAALTSGDITDVFAPTTGAIVDNKSTYSTYWIGGITTGTTATIVVNATSSSKTRTVAGKSYTGYTLLSAPVTVEVPANSTIVLEWYLGGASKYFTVSDPSGTNVTTSSNGLNKQSVRTTVVVTDAGTYTFTGSDPSKMELCAIGVIAQEVAQDTYTITGTSNLKTDDSFSLTLGNSTYTASVKDETGEWEAFGYVEQGADAPFGTDSVLTVVKSQYDANPSTVTLTAGNDDNTFNAGAITFTMKELGYLEGKSYSASDITAALPNFEVSDAPNAKVNNKGYIGFKLDRDATVTVNAKIGTSNDGKTATLFYSTDKTATSGTNICQLQSGDTSFADYSVDLSAGTYYFICKSPDTDYVANSDSTSVQISSITVNYKDTVVSTDSTEKVAVIAPASGDTYYAVLAVSEIMAKESAGFRFAGVTSDTVYKSITIGDKTYEASEFATGAEYVFAVEIDSVDDATATAIQTIQSKLTAVFTAE